MIYIILILLFAITKSERDLIGSNQFHKTLFPIKRSGVGETNPAIWYNTKDYRGRSWWIENVFSFLGNGWHLNDFINIAVGHLFFALLIGNIWYGVISFILAGTFHSWRNGSLFR